MGGIVKTVILNCVVLLKKLLDEQSRNDFKGILVQVLGIVCIPVGLKRVNFKLFIKYHIDSMLINS